MEDNFYHAAQKVSDYHQKYFSDIILSPQMVNMVLHNFRKGVI